MSAQQHFASVSTCGRTSRWVIMGTVLLTSVFPVDLLPSAPHARQGADGQYSVKQGQVLLVRIPTGKHQPEVTGRFLGRTVLFFPARGDRAEGAVGLLGIDIQDKPGMHEFMVEVRERGATRRLSYNILVIKESYPIQHLTLPSEQVDLDDENLVRVKAEQEQVQTVLQGMSRERLWDGPFLEPVQGEVLGAFGRTRIINGQSRSPHNGEDISAPLGTPVVAMNDGIARLTVDHFFSGKGVFLDHGLGLYSMYFHLAEVLVHDGAIVKRGQTIGKVGATGRATGPHLHLGVRLSGARVNPYALVNLPLDGVVQAAR